MKLYHSISEVKNRFTAIIHEIEDGGTVHVTRHGKTVAVILAAGDYKELMETREGFWDRFAAFRNSRTDLDRAMDDSVFIPTRDRSVGRDVEFE